MKKTQTIAAAPAPSPSERIGERLLTPEKTSILIIDDNPQKITMLKSILEDLDFNLVSVTSGTDGLRMLLHQEFACILLDVNMPIMDGFETAKLIRSNQKFADIHILFITAVNITELDMHQGYSIGAADYLTSPLVPEILKAKVKLFVELYEKTKRLKWKKQMLEESQKRLIKNSIHIQELNNELTTSKLELEKTIKDRDTFFSIIAHDLKGPLSAIFGLAEVLAEDAGEFPVSEITEICRSIFNSVGKVNVLLENLLQWAQLQKGTLEFSPSGFSINQTIAENIDFIKPRAVQKGIQLCDETSGVLNVYADEKMIQTILRNLLSNAVKFTDRGGKVVLKASEKDRQTVEVSVSDTGIGISENNIGKLFKLDEKVSHVGTSGEPSSGLGLVLCQEFVRKNGGEIRVESKLNEGTTIYFTMPKKEDVKNEKIAQ